MPRTTETSHHHCAADHTSTSDDCFDFVRQQGAAPPTQGLSPALVFVCDSGLFGHAVRLLRLAPRSWDRAAADDCSGSYCCLRCTATSSLVDDIEFHTGPSTFSSDFLRIALWFWSSVFSFLAFLFSLSRISAFGASHLWHQDSAFYTHPAFSFAFMVMEGFGDKHQPQLINIQLSQQHHIE